MSKSVEEQKMRIERANHDAVLKAKYEQKQRALREMFDQAQRNKLRKEK